MKLTRHLAQSYMGFAFWWVKLSALSSGMDPWGWLSRVERRNRNQVLENVLSRLIQGNQLTSLCSFVLKQSRRGAHIPLPGKAVR